MTEEEWAAIPSDRRADVWNTLTKANQAQLLSEAGLTRQLIGLEGWRVQVTDHDGETRRFIVGRSTGWIPCHIEIKTRRSLGGGSADGRGYRSVRTIEKIR